MFSESQRLYLEDVLGTSVASYRAAPAAAAPAVTPSVPTIVVLTPALAAATRALLEKILQSVKLNQFTHIEGDAVVEAAHCLHFAEGVPVGRRASDTGVYWGFHDLNHLLGAGAEVTRRKREVWTLLQAFALEIQ